MGNYGGTSRIKYKFNTRREITMHIEKRERKGCIYYETKENNLTDITKNFVNIQNVNGAKIKRKSGVK